MLIYILLVLLFATVIRSAFGFGEALVAVPMLGLAIPLATAAPLAVAMSVTVAIVILLQDWRKMHIRSAGILLAASLAGIPLGLLLLTHGNQLVIRVLLALIIILFAILGLTGWRPATLHRDKPLWITTCGFIAGILGGAYGLNGPPLVIYGAMRQWSAQQFRATLQGYFLPASFLGLGGYFAAGLWTPEVTRLYFISLPVVIPAVFVGRAINRRFQGDRFYRYVYATLLVVGCIFLAQALVKTA